MSKEKEERERLEALRKDEENQKRIQEEKELALKHKEEEELRIIEENRRLKEWEEKFDREQKIKEDKLIQKFYSNELSDHDSQDINLAENIEKNNIDEKKND